LELGQRVLVAVSGGQDSLCLLKLLLDLQPKWNWHLAIAHCDHRWPGDIGNADFVHSFACSWNLPFYLQTAAEINQTEAGAREWRYRALSAIAQHNGFSCIATGHTASDRAETLLYNLIRGSGADGLQALTWQRSLAPGISLIRPLLTVTRSETAQFCREMQLQIWDDPANQDRTYARNRIRQELLPYLSDHFNPQVEHALAQTAELLQAEVAYLEQAAAELFQQSRHPDQPGLNRSLLRQAPLALQRRAIRQWLQAELTCSPNFEHVEKVIALLTAPNRSQTDPFPGGTIAHVEGNWIKFKYPRT
jgi:tRNA(Ile)-lysidine synthase